MEKLLPVNKHTKTTMPHNILYKKIFVPNSFYKFMRRRMAWGTPPPLTRYCFVYMCLECRLDSCLPVPEPTHPPIKFKFFILPPLKLAQMILLTATRLASRIVLGIYWTLHKELMNT